MKKRILTDLPIDLGALKKVHMVGIMGSGMSGLAGILAHRGVTIQGSDSHISLKSSLLKKQKISYYEGIRLERITKDISCIIASLAVPESHPEKKKARTMAIPILSYPEAVGLLTQRLRTVSICGTHGKTTTTAMIAKVLLEHEFDPTVLVGSDLKELHNSNFHVGKNPLFILESCEYQKAFLNYHPNIIVLNNLDPDHLDYYKTYKNYLMAFIDFCKRLPKSGYLFANIDDEDVHAVIKKLRERGFPSFNIFTYSQNIEASDYYLKQNVIYHKGKPHINMQLAVSGIHNRSNALAAFAVCHSLGVASTDIGISLSLYTGAARRFELIGHIVSKGKKIDIIDDYGHHPEEIKATLQAVTERYGDAARICVIFQPHQYSRTRFLFNDFVAALSPAYTVVVPFIYEARDSEEDKKAVSAEKLVAALKKNGTSAIHSGSLEATAEYVKKHKHNFDVIIIMGAGDVWKVGRLIISQQKTLPLTKLS